MADSNALAAATPGLLPRKAGNLSSMQPRSLGCHLA